MSEKILRTLIPGAYSSSVPPATDSASQGRVGPYLERARHALAGARGLARPSTRRFVRPSPASEIERAARELIKGVRVAHGLSGTRERDLRVLVRGERGRGIVGLSAPWAQRLEPLCALAETTLSRADAAPWLALLSKLIEDAGQLRTMPPPKRLRPPTRSARQMP